MLGKATVNPTIHTCLPQLYVLLEAHEFARIISPKTDYLPANLKAESIQASEEVKTNLLSLTELFTANVSVLREGVDVPELQSIFIRDGSRVPTIQMD